MANQVSTDELKDNISQRGTWLRLLYIVLFAVIFIITEFIVAIVVIIQFGFVLLTGGVNTNLKDFGDDLSRYVYDILRYLTFNSDSLPFPFSDWSYGGTSTRAAPAPKKAASKKTGKKKASRK